MDRPGHWHHPTGFGTLGYALPAAIGGKIGRGDLPVLAIAGDYGFQYTVQELAVAVELELSLPGKNEKGVVKAVTSHGVCRPLDVLCTDSLIERKTVSIGAPGVLPASTKAAVNGLLEPRPSAAVAPGEVE